MHDAIIVGAGLSGLVCARRLTAAGAKVLVVEARSRVGGRLHSGRVGDATVDLGGSWMSVGQPRLLALAGELGVSSWPQPRTGRPIFDDAGRGQGLFAQLHTMLASLRAVRQISRLIRRVPLDAPATAADALALDAISVGSWLAGAIDSPVARARIALHAELVFAADLADLSLLAYLARLGATGGFSPRGPDLPGGGRDHCFTGGAQQLAIALADQLGPLVHLDEPVAAIEAAATSLGPTAASLDPTGTSLVVHNASDRRASYTARHVVLAIPPALAAKLTPSLPAPLRQLATANRPGHVVKWFAAYDQPSRQPFWRDAGLSGEAYRPDGPIRAVVDASPPGGPAVLAAFIVGPAATSWHTLDASSRRGIFLDALADLFGEPARHPLATAEADWSIDSWSAGCVAGTPPGALAALSATTTWRGQHNRIHLAGTEAAIHWPGYMEGAIEAGERAAADILATG